MTRNKGGRPRKSNSKSERLIFRVTEHEREIITIAAERTDRSLSNFIHHATMRETVRVLAE